MALVRLLPCLQRAPDARGAAPGALGRQADTAQGVWACRVGVPCGTYTAPPVRVRRNDACKDNTAAPVGGFAPVQARLAGISAVGRPCKLSRAHRVQRIPRPVSHVHTPSAVLLEHEER